MADVEIHTGPGHTDDAFSQRVGVMVGILGVLLSVVTILAHREHTAAILLRTQANDDWSYYQAKKIREHNDELAAMLLGAIGNDPSKVAGTGAKFTREGERYGLEAADLQNKANGSEAASKRSEDRAVRFDLGEGFLELGVVMSSLYFLSHRRFFVAFGAVAALVGTAAGVLGVLG
jgi:hypothetical protein